MSQFDLGSNVTMDSNSSHVTMDSNSNHVTMYYTLLEYSLLVFSLIGSQWLFLLKTRWHFLIG